MIENLILIGIGVLLGIAATVGAIYVIARWKLDQAMTKLDRADRLLKFEPEDEIDPEKLRDLLREVSDLEDDE